MLKKSLYAALAALTVCFVLILVVLFSSSLQRSLVLMVLNKNADQSRLESFELSWNELELKGLYLMKDGLGLGIDSLDFKGSFSSFLFGGAYDIDKVKVKGLVVDMRSMPAGHSVNTGTPSQPSSSAHSQPVAGAGRGTSTKQGNEGALSLLPKPFKLDDLSVEGKAYLADNRVVTFDVDGDDFKPGKTGTLKLKADVNQGDSTDAKLKSTLELTQGSEPKSPSLALELKAEGETKTHMEDLGPRLEDISFKSHVAFAFKDGTLVLKAMDSTFSDGKGDALCSLELERELELPTNGDISKMLGLTGELIRLKLSELPLALLSPLIPGYTLSGTLNPWTFSLEGAGKGTFLLKPAMPLSISGLSVASEGVALLDAVNVSLTPSAEYVFGKDLDAHVASIALHNRSGDTLLSGDIEGTVTMPSNKPSELQAQGTFDAELSKLFTQPVLAAFNNIAKGDAGLEFTAQCTLLDKSSSAKATIYLKDIQPNGAQRGTSATIDATANMLNTGAMTLSVPVTVEGAAGHSEGTLVVDKSASSKWVLDWNSDVLYADDLVALSQAFQPVVPTSKTAVPAKDGGAPESGVIAASKDTASPAAKSSGVTASKAFWAGVDAQAKARVNRVIQGGTLFVENLSASFLVDDRQMMLETFSAQLMGAPLNLGGGLTFDETAATPYGLKAQFSLKQFDLGKFLTITKMTHSSPVQGLFDVNGKAESRGESLDVLTHNIQGDFTLQSQQGVFRPLMATDKGIQAGAAVVGIAGVVNSLTGNKVGAVDTLNQLVSFIQKIDYDQLYVHANRGETLNIDLDSMVVQGPQILLTGAGSVTYKAGVPVPEQPLYAKAQLGAQGDAAQMLNELGLLTGKQNGQGYYLGPTFEVKGTAANPDLSQLYTVLQQAAIGAATGGGKKSGSSSGSSEQSPVSDVVKGIKGLFK